MWKPILETMPNLLVLTLVKKPIEEIAKDYTDYYLSHGWTPDPIFKTKDNWGVSASKDKSLLNVALIPRSDGTVMVSITLTNK
jgi:hypothetical protein